MSGKCGNMIFKTFKRPNGKTETRAYFNPHYRAKLRREPVRKTPLSDAEVAARRLFAKRREFVSQLIASGRCKSAKEAWKIAKQEVID